MKPQDGNRSQDKAAALAASPKRTNDPDSLSELDQKIRARIQKYDELPVVYANLWSKLLFGRAFKLQFPIPVPQPAWMKSILGVLERKWTPRDLDTVKIDRPIFVVGLPRSGTTLLHYLLSAHPRAAYINNVMNTLPDTILAIERVRSLLKLNISGDRHLRDSIEVDFTSPSEPIMAWQIWTRQNLYDLEFKKLSAASLGADAVHRIKSDIRKVLLASHLDGPRFVCKYPYFSMQMPLLQELFPDAKFVHIVRRPDSVAHSMIKLFLLIEHQRQWVNHPTVKTLIPYPRVPSLKKLIETLGPESTTTTATVWKEAIEELQSDRPKIRNLLEVRYEDLVGNPEVTLEKILSFCELEKPSPTSGKFWREFAKIGKLRHQSTYPAAPEIWSVVRETAKTYGYFEN
jgi:hypothetical protein